MTDPSPKTSKVNHVGAPKVFALELACQHINEAFDSEGFGCYLVGSCLQRPDWRDIDIRFIMPDEEFAKLFPIPGSWLPHQVWIWEHDPKWLLLTVSISEHLSKLTGLPVDFQFQPQTYANERYKGMRQAIGMKVERKEEGEKEEEDETH
jgi:hypothetical protein